MVSFLLAYTEKKVEKVFLLQNTQVMGQYTFECKKVMKLFAQWHAVLMFDIHLFGVVVLYI